MSEATPRTIYRVAPGPLRFVEKADKRIEFRPGVRQPFVVHFSDGACRGMRQEISRVASHGVETGGLLYALRPACPTNLELCRIVHATPPASTARHAWGSLSMGSVNQIEREMPDFLGHLQWVGDWHSQPDGHVPSTTDMEGWAQIVELSRRTHYISLVLTRDAEGGLGWMSPRGGAYVTFMEGDRMVCEQAKITDSGY